MAFNLLSNEWIPVVRASGARDVIRPAQIVDQGDPVIALGFGRADLDCAAREFLIGLFAVAHAPKNDDEWLEQWENAPTIDQIDADFAPFVKAFDVDGDGPRFMQCPDARVTSEVLPIVTLPLSGPGKETVEKNADVFNKRDAFTHVSPGVAALMLFAVNSWGGRIGGGHKMPMRGGGSLTTVIAPREPNLWRAVWLSTPNVDASYPPAVEAIDKIFPWVGKIVTSEDKQETSPRSSHILHAYFGMPRRFAVDFVKNVDRKVCPFSGVTPETLGVSMRRLSQGQLYAGSFVHPLSPHKVKVAKGVQSWSTFKAVSEGVPYAAWPDLVRATEATSIAKAVADAERRLLLAGEVSASLTAWGYAIGTVVEAFVEAQMPVFAIDPKLEAVFYSAAQAQAGAAAALVGDVCDRVLRTLISDLNTGQFNKKKWDNARTSTMAISLRSHFYASTEAAFHTSLEKLSKDLVEGEDAGPIVEASASAWLAVLKRAALETFSAYAPPLSGASKSSMRAVENLNFLKATLNGYSKDGGALYKALGVPQPQKKAA